MQVLRRCTSIAQAGGWPGMNAVDVSVSGMAGAMKQLDVLLRPVLTSLAVAHLRLGADGVALAYATAAAMMVWHFTPPAAACVAARVLNRMALPLGACMAMALVCRRHWHAVGVQTDS